MRGKINIFCLLRVREELECKPRAQRHVHGLLHATLAAWKTAGDVTAGSARKAKQLEGIVSILNCRSKREMGVGALTRGDGDDCLRVKEGDDGPQLDNMPAARETGACTDCGIKKPWGLGLRRTLHDHAASGEGAFDGVDGAMRADCDPVFNSTVVCAGSLT